MLEQRIMPVGTFRTAEITHLQHSPLPTLEGTFSGRMYAIHDWTRKTLLPQSGIVPFIQGSSDTLAPHAQTELEKLRDDAQRVVNAANSPEIVDTLTRLNNQFNAIDNTTQGQPSSERIRARVASLPNPPEVVLDMDNTITDRAKQGKQGDIDPLLLGSEICDPLIGKDREYFPQVFAGVWKHLLSRYPEVFFEGGAQAQLRDGMADLIQRLHDNGSGIIVLTTNFGPFVNAVMEKLPNPERIRIIAVEKDSLVATLKGHVLSILAAQASSKGRPTIFVGDGKSDKPALQAQGVAGHFALRGAGFHRELEKAGMLYSTYTTGHDIQTQLFDGRRIGKRETW